MNKKYLFVVVGPTAVGKTAMGIELAQHFQTEIISADSRQVYRQMELGTAKPDQVEMAAARHHFVNVMNIDNEFNAGQFEDEALQLLDNLFLKNDTVLMVGGSGLYVKALCDGIDEMPKIDPMIREKLNKQKEAEGLGSLVRKLAELDPAYYQIVDQNNPQRIIRALEVIESSGLTYSYFRTQKKAKRSFEIIKVGLELPREILYKRIDNRMDLMIEKGLFEEAAELFPKRHLNALQTVGYSEIFRYLEGEYDKEEAIRLLKRNSRRYAKRQLTWFKKDESTQWFSPSQFSEIIAYLDNQSNIQNIN